MKLVNNKGLRRVLAGLLSVFLVLSDLQAIPAKAASTDTAVEVSEATAVSEAVSGSDEGVDVIVSETPEGDDVPNYAEGFTLWFNNDGATGIAAGQQGTYPVYAGEAMGGNTNKITIGGTDHYSVQGSGNPKKGGSNPNGAIPDSGAYLKVIAPADGNIIVYGYKSNGKPFYATKDNESKGTISNAAFDNETFYSISVKEGEEWYFYAQGSKAQFVGVEFALPKPSHEIGIVWNAESPLGSDTVTFTNQTTKESVTVSASDTKVTLQEGYIYSISVSAGNLVVSPTELDLTGEIPTNIELTVENAPLHTVSGSFKGLPEGAAVTEVSFTDGDGVKTDGVVDGNTYTVSLKNGEYTTAATVTGADGYTVYDHVLVEGTDGESYTNDVWFYASATVYPVEYKDTLKVGTAEDADYATITEAIAAAKAMTRTADQWVTLVLLDEIYNEQVIVNTNNIAMKPQSGVSKISWYYGIGYKYYSIDSTGYYNLKNANDAYKRNYAQRWGATVRVTGTGFKAENIYFENSFNVKVVENEIGDSAVGSSTEYGQSISGSLEERTSTTLDVHNTKNVERAAAIALDGDKAEFENCTFVSSQDTVYTGTKNSYFHNCTISGQTDYIFGNTDTKAIFDDCTLTWFGYTGTAKEGYITATRGSYLFRGCTVAKNTAEGVNVTAGYFGRPWGNTAAATFVGTTIGEGCIKTAGWYEMSGVKPENVEFHEYGNKSGEDFFLSSYAADTETYPGFALTAAQAAELVVLANDTTFLGGWTPSYQRSEALDLSAYEGWGSAEEEEPTSGLAGDYILNASSLADGATGAAGTSDFFTIGSSMVVEGNTKTFTVGEDSIEVTKRIKSASATYETGRSIKFVVPEGYTASVVACAVSGSGSKNSAIGIYKGTETTPIESFDLTGGATPTSVFTETLEAGTYYLGVGQTDGSAPATSANIYYVKVTLEVDAPDLSGNYILNASDLTDGATGVAGTSDFFTIGSSMVVEGNTKTFTVGEDSIEVTKRIKSASATYETGRSIKFVVPEGYTASVVACAVSGSGSKNSAIGIYKGTATTPIESFDLTGGATPTSVFTETLEAGTYYLGVGQTGGAAPATSANIYYVKVTLASTEAPTGSAPVVASAAATISEEKDNEIIVSWTNTTEGSGDGYYQVYVSTDGTTFTATGDKLGHDKTSYVYKCTATGCYTFKVTGGIGSEENEGAVTPVPVNYVLPLAKPVIKSVTAGDAKVVITWSAVAEATSYKVGISYTDNPLDFIFNNAEENATSYTFTDLENGTYYYIKVASVRGGDEQESDVVYAVPYVPIDASNAIPGLAIVNQNNEATAIVIRDGANITISQSATSGGVASGKTTNESFIQWPTAITTDFTFTTKVKITGKTISGTSGGLFMGMFSGNGESDSLAALALRGDGSINNYRTKDSKTPVGSRGGSAFTMKWEIGKTYTLTVTRSGNKLTETISDGKTSESKEYDALNASAAAEVSKYVECTALKEGAPVYASIALAGITADFSDIKLTVPGESSDSVLFDSTTLTGSFSPFIDNWDKVPDPSVKSVTVDNAAGTITVVTECNIGATGASTVQVEMYNSENPTEAVATKSSSAFGTREQTFVFTPSASGAYGFVVKAYRDPENYKESSTTYYNFVLPLAKPRITAVYNGGADSDGKGCVIVEWDPVPEADGYRVICNNEVYATVTQTGVYSVYVYYLEIGSTAELQIQAVQTGEFSAITKEGPISDKASITVTEEKQSKWSSVTYGTSTDTTNNGVIGNINNGPVQIYSKDGKGKIVPASCQDGLTYYYTKINPNAENFTLSAKLTVDSWKLSNGQEGFGILLADTIGTNGSTSVVWNNSIMAAATKIEYYYDRSANAVTTDSGKDKITMKIGLGTIARTGVTAEDVAYNAATGTFLYSDGSEQSLPENFVSKTTTLETSCGNNGPGTYNLFGNSTDSIGGTIENPLTEVYMTVQRNNTGYIVRYTNASGDVLGENKIYDYDRNLLTMIDEDTIYVGFFASRNASVTVSDVTLTTIDPDLDEPAEERPIEYIAPTAKIESATYANRSDYTLTYYGNFDGRITVKLGSTEIVKGKKVTANEKTEIGTVLASGTNDFVITVTPDQSFRPEGKDYMRLSSYDAITINHSVLLKGYESQILYVAPDGSAYGTGEKNSPLDVYTAVKYVRPGQTIYLAGGTYKLSKTIKVERGINGTDFKKITMMADPDAASRPVFDFCGKCAGMILAGNYWVFKGFDVTRSANAQKGIQLSGSNNVLQDINTYRNGNTGLQISRYMISDTSEFWPSDNLIKNCTSYLNADAGYEDADGFAAKLTCGDGNQFEGCISAYNADDGWDLYAKTETGSIGSVVISNSVAFKNGYVLDADGNEISAGNGNGFKMGGESLSGYHKLDGSIAFANKAKGIDSNSCPDIKVTDSISFDNESYNVALYTNMAKNTAFSVHGLISYKKSNTIVEQLKPIGSQSISNLESEYNFYTYGANNSHNSSNVAVSDDWFESLDTAAVIAAFKAYVAGDVTTGGLSTVEGKGITRNEDGSINMNGYLELTEKGESMSNGNSCMKPGTETPEDDTVYRVVLTEGITSEVIENFNRFMLEGTGEYSIDAVQDILINQMSCDLTYSCLNADDLSFYSFKIQKYVDGEWTDCDESPVIDKTVLIEIDEKARENRVYYYEMSFMTREADNTFDPSGNFANLGNNSISFNNCLASFGVILLAGFDKEDAVEEDWWGDITDEDLDEFDITDGFYIPEGTWVAGVPESVNYTGKAICPTVRVYDGNKLLKKGTDYTVEYKQNVNANDASNPATAPVIILKGKGNYASSVIKKYFAINPIDISSDSKIAVSDIVRTYNKNAKKPVPKMTFGSKVLSTDKDIKIEYIDSDTDTTKAYVDCGTWKIKVVGRGKNYVGERIVTLTVTDCILMSATSVKKIADQHYTGVAMTPALKITYTNSKKRTTTLNGMEASQYNALTDLEAKSAVDYIYSYSNNVVVGTAKVEITGVNKYTGTVIKSFKVLGNSLSARTTTVKGVKSSLAYTGSAITQNITISSTAYKYYYDEDGRLKKVKAGSLNGVTESEYAVMTEEEQAGVDYTINYLNNVQIGKATVVLTGRNHFTGTVKKTFSITGISMKKVTADSIAAVDFAYYAQYPDLTLKYTTGRGANKVTTTLKRGVDYTAVYKNNTSAGTASIVVTGIGKYTGTKTVKFTIKPINLKTGYTDGSVNVSAGDVIWFKKNSVDASPDVSLNGNSLRVGKDYKVSFANIDAIRPVSSNKAAKLVINGTGNFTGTISIKVPVLQRELSGENVIADNMDIKVSSNPGKYKPAKIALTLQSTSGVYGTRRTKLTAKTDYKVIKYLYAYDCYVFENGERVERTAGTIIGENDVIPSGVRLAILIEGCGNYTGTFKVTYRVCDVLLSDKSITIDSVKENYSPDSYGNTSLDLSKLNLTYNENGVAYRLSSDGCLMTYSDYVNAKKLSSRKVKASVVIGINEGTLQDLVVDDDDDDDDGGDVGDDIEDPNAPPVCINYVSAEGETVYNPDIPFRDKDGNIKYLVVGGTRKVTYTVVGRAFEDNEVLIP